MGILKEDVFYCGRVLKNPTNDYKVSRKYSPSRHELLCELSEKGLTL